MKLFCAYAFSGEDLSVLTQRMNRVVETLTAAGHDAYCNRFDPTVDELQKTDNIQGIFKQAFQKITEYEAVIAIVTSPNKSSGQVMEIGVAMSQDKPFYLFEHTSAKGSSYLPRLASKYFPYTTDEVLFTALHEI